MGLPLKGSEHRQDRNFPSKEFTQNNSKLFSVFGSKVKGTIQPCNERNTVNIVKCEYECRIIVTTCWNTL